MATATRFTGSNAVRIALLAFFACCWFLNYRAGTHFTLCLFRNITGHSCYGCGFLRGLSAVLHGHPRYALGLNCLNAVSIPVFIYVMVRGFIAGSI